MDPGRREWSSELWQCVLVRRMGEVEGTVTCPEGGTVA